MLKSKESLRHILSACIASAALIASRAWAATCGELVNLNLAGVTIDSAFNRPAGLFTPPGSAEALETPAFCRVVATARPTSDSVIHFEVWVPSVGAWNGNFEGIGNGGYSGTIRYSELSSAVKRGFAAASTDTGHEGDDLRFAEGHPEKIVDWGYRSVHVMTEASKVIVRNYAGRYWRHSLFVGCSTGGAQALSEVQRFPSDYDGVVAGDPGNDRVHLNVGFLWAFAATHDANGHAVLPSSKLPLVNAAALAACDAGDGIKDGIISEPGACQFDPGILRCASEENDQCLTRAQIEAVKKVYAGPRNPRTGEQIIAGYSPGSEGSSEDRFEGGWKTYITEPSEPMRLDFWRYWVFNDAAWDWRAFDYDRDVAYANEKLAAVNASSPDLRMFKARGGKILMYSGWADPVGPPMDAVNYYERVQKFMGGRRNTESFFRLFMVPGMGHCFGGPGPSILGGPRAVRSAQIGAGPEHDVVSALVRWIENDTAPERLIAAHFEHDAIDRTRPLCPYPKRARWRGTGSSDDARNFTCVETRGGGARHPVKR